jgi:hypothetical protein
MGVLLPTFRQLTEGRMTVAMKRLWILSGCLCFLVPCSILWYSIADYGDDVTSGTYYLARNSESSTLVLRPDHTFQQELSEHGQLERATGTWRRVGESGVEFSKEFLAVAGQEPRPDGSAWADMYKDLGFLVSLHFRQYYVQSYVRVDPSSSNTVSGTYTGDEPGISAKLVLYPDHTFEQTIHTVSTTNQAKGTWRVGQNGDIIFSNSFLKASGKALSSNETASAWDPKGSLLQIQIATAPGSRMPNFRKKQFF